MSEPPIEILYQDSWVIAAWKPHGMSTLCPPGGRSLQTVLASQFEATPKSMWVVHRLDRLTAGIVLVARTKSAASMLSKQFEVGRVEKSYSAVVHLPGPSPLPTPGRWVDWIIKLPGQAKVVASHADHDGAKQCLTTLSSSSDGATPQQAKLRLHPKTGRMHQLRFQCAIRGMPIVGDPVYGTATNDEVMQLVANQIRFFHPKTAKPIDLQSPAEIS